MFDLDTVIKITLFGLCGVFLTLGLLMVMMHVVGRVLKRFF